MLETYALKIAVQWLVEEGGIEQILGQEETEENLLTAYSVRGILDEYIGRLLERMDEERIRQLAGGLSQLKDAKKTAAYRTLLGHALHIFHEIAALPASGRTGGFRNEQLRSIAFLGMAAVHQSLGDGDDLIGEKIVKAVDADIETAESFLGKKVCTAILRRISPDQFFQLSGSLLNRDVIFPADCMYLAPPGLLSPSGLLFSAHLWIREETGPITGFPFYVVGLTRYSAQLLGSDIIWNEDNIHLPKKGSKVRQMKKCGKFDMIGGKVPIYAPLSGTVTEVNEIWSKSLVVRQDPYGEGWLFKISPVYVNPERYKREVANLLNADAYRALISTEDIPGTVNVNSIAYTTKGGKNNNKHLLISIALVDHLGNPVSDASVEIQVYCEDEDFSGLKGTTGIDGTVTFTIKNAPSGRYSTNVYEVQAGDQWLIDGVKGKKVLLFNYSWPGNEFYK